MHSILHVTPLGEMQVLWTSNGLLHACEFYRESEFGLKNSLRERSFVSLDDLTNVARERHELLEETLDSYFKTGSLSWDLSLLDWSGISAFHRAALRECYAIEAGQTIAYGELARRAGSPLAARAAGAAMARNRWPILIPCHRVVGSGGKLVGYSGTGGVATKRYLLEFESLQNLPLIASAVAIA